MRKSRSSHVLTYISSTFPHKCFSLRLFIYTCRCVQHAAFHTESPMSECEYQTNLTEVKSYAKTFGSCECPTLGLVDPGRGGTREWRTIGVVDPASGGSYEWCILGVANPGSGRPVCQLEDQIGIRFLASHS